MTLISPYADYINLLMTITGIDRNSAITIISEIVVDMSQFKNNYRLSAWAGLALIVMNLLAKRNLLKFLVLVFILSIF